MVLKVEFYQKNNLNLQTTFFKTPLGTAKIVGDNNGIQSVSVLDKEVSTSIEETNLEISECLKQCVVQLDEYFTGQRTSFDLKLNPQGTTFQKRVWDELLNIPYNKTRTYLEQSKL